MDGFTFTGPVIGLILLFIVVKFMKMKVGVLVVGMLIWALVAPTGWAQSVQGGLGTAFHAVADRASAAVGK
jgi:hypothetical protein